MMSKRVLVILGHPSTDSFCGALTDTYVEAASVGAVHVFRRSFQDHFVARTIRQSQGMQEYTDRLMAREHIRHELAVRAPGQRRRPLAAHRDHGRVESQGEG